MGDSRLRPQSVHRIRTALERVPGALRYDPTSEDAGVGDGPAIEIATPGSHAGARFEQTDAPGAQFEPELEGGVVDEPLVGFEIAPQMTDARVRDVFGDDRIGELSRLQEIRGVDALGWYLTFHQMSQQYGIYIRFEAIVWMALECLRDVAVPLSRRIELAFHAVLRHELFHFETDRMIANWELATGVEVYWSSRKYRNAAGYIELEEELANAYMLRGFKYPTRLLGNASGAYVALRKLCERQPDGYKDGPRYLRPAAGDLYLRECSQLADDYHQASAAPWHVPDEFDTLKLYNDVTLIDWTRCPIILQDQFNLQEVLGVNVSYFQCVKNLHETDSFKRALEKLDSRHQKLWLAKKQQLAHTTASNGLDFKPWAKGGRDVYSIRLDRNYRAHLRYDRADKVWFAEAVGNHKQMGHG